MKKILFRADAAPYIGIGDLMSLINLSRYLDETYEKYFIIKNYQAGVNLVEKYNLENCFIIDSSITLKDEINYINNIIDSNNIDIIFFEITERKLSEYIGINEKVKKVAVNFDGYILDDLDLVIDWDVEAHRFFNPTKYPHTKFLLGHEYVILPKEFYSKKVLIAMGGADELDFTGRVVDIIVKSHLDIELNIIIGSGYEYKDQLEDKLIHTKLKYQIKQNISNMLNEYSTCHIGIGAGGLTSSEMVAANISPILIATYKHQIARCEFFDKQGWAKYLGYSEFDDIELVEAIKHPVIPYKENIFNTYTIVDEIEKL